MKVKALKFTKITDFTEMGIFHGRRPISRKMSRPWNRELGWSLLTGLAQTQNTSTANGAFICACILSLTDQAVLIRFLLAMMTFFSSIYTCNSEWRILSVQFSHCQRIGDFVHQLRRFPCQIGQNLTVLWIICWNYGPLGKNWTSDCPVLTKIVNWTFRLKPDCPVKNRTCGNPSCIFASILDFAEFVHFISVLYRALLHSYPHHWQ